MFVGGIKLVLILNTFINFIYNFNYISLKAYYTWYNDPAVFKYEFPQAEIKRANFLANNEFPDSFYFGVATSAYECEGAWNATGMTYMNMIKISIKKVWTFNYFADFQIFQHPYSSKCINCFTLLFYCSCHCFIIHNLYVTCYMKFTIYMLHVTWKKKLQL